MSKSMLRATAAASSVPLSAYRRMIRSKNSTDIATARTSM